MMLQKRKTWRTALWLFAGGLVLAALIAAVVVARTWGRTVLQIDIHQNRELIYLSTFAEPPQFAIWLEDPATGELKTVFVTHRVAVGDWEGKANVPVALPQWFRLFRGNDNPAAGYHKKGSDLVVTGATPKEDFFTVRVEVKPGSEWICHIEMNLAGDFNDAFPEFDTETFYEDEFSCGQPALIWSARLKADEGSTFVPHLEAQAVWDNGEVTVGPVSAGVTTARQVFDDMKISVIRPKPKLIEKYKLEN